MSVSSPCEICLSGAVEHTCRRCGKLVCEDHFDDESGLCVDCLAEVGPPRTRDKSPKRSPDGVDTYRF